MTKSIFISITFLLTVLTGNLFSQTFKIDSITVNPPSGPGNCDATFQIHSSNACAPITVTFCPQYNSFTIGQCCMTCTFVARDNCNLTVYDTIFIPCNNVGVQELSKTNLTYKYLNKTIYLSKPISSAEVTDLSGRQIIIQDNLNSNELPVPLINGIYILNCITVDKETFRLKLIVDDN
jgi:hypothetical protein